MVRRRKIIKRNKFAETDVNSTFELSINNFGKQSPFALLAENS